MFALYISSTKYTLLELTPTEKGKFTLSHYFAEELDHQNLKDTDLLKPREIATQINKRVKDADDVVVILPESAYFTTRVTATSSTTPEEIDKMALKAINLTTSDVVGTSKVIKKDGDKWTYLHIAIPQKYSAQYDNLLSHLDASVSHIFPESVATFPILKDSTSPSEVLVYLASANSLIFYDQLGPIESVSLPGEANLEKEVLEAATAFYKKTKRKVKTLVTQPSLLSQLGKLDVEIVPTSNLLESQIAEMSTAGFEGIDIESLNPAVLGLFLLDQTTTIDLLKTEKEVANVATTKIPLAEVLKDDKLNKMDSDNLTSSSSGGRKMPVSYLLSLFVAFLAGCVLTGTYFTLAKPGTSTLTAKITPTPEPTSAPTPTPPLVNRNEVKIRVTNGTTTSGLAAKLADILKELGYTQVTTGNADKQDYKVTTIRVKDSQKDLLSLLQSDLKSEVASTSAGEKLLETDTSDAIVILGTDFAESQE